MEDVDKNAEWSENHDHYAGYTSTYVKEEQAPDSLCDIYIEDGSNISMDKTIDYEAPQYSAGNQQRFTHTAQIPTHIASSGFHDFKIPRNSGMEEKRAKKFACPKCSKKYIRKSHLTSHIKLECSKPPRYKCPYCQYRSITSGNIYRHIPRKHADSKKTCLFLDLTETKSAGRECWVTVSQRRSKRQMLTALS